LDRQSAGVTLEDPPEHYSRIAKLAEAAEQGNPLAVIEPRSSWLDTLAGIGMATAEAGRTAFDLLAFLGEVVLHLGAVLRKPSLVSGTSIVHHMQQAGVSALPILGLLSFLIGVVTAYQGADQLARFGAEIFTVNVVGVGVLREMGGLIAAIVVAGRSASAFAAQIGTMKINEEIDALRVIGIDPMAALVLPRLLALLFIFPLLVVFADAMGIIGGALMAMIALDISLAQFAIQFQAEVPLEAFWLGLVKTPLFAAGIAIVGCHQGLQVGQGAGAVGERTTVAVVQAIFLVIVIDAIMSVIFSILGL
jgi:phospholipid/cholesterol/gamma-HCH transport system permease protein